MSCLTDCWVNYFRHFGGRYMYKIKVILMIKSHYCMWHMVFMTHATHERYWLLYRFLATICFHERTKPTLYHPALQPLGVLVNVLHTFPGSIKYNEYLYHANVCYVDQICTYIHARLFYLILGQYHVSLCECCRTVAVERLNCHWRGG